MQQQKFFHYTRFCDEIKNRGKLLAASYTKTSTYDFVLDFCPEVLLTKKDIQKLNDYKKRNGERIKKIRKEWNDDLHYYSAYRNLKFKYLNKKFRDFSINKGYVLTFSELFENGWIKKSGKSQEKGSRVFLKVGNKYIEFEITRNQIRKSFVLDQKYWMPNWMNAVMKKKYGKKWWDLYLKYDKIFYKDLKILDGDGEVFMKYFSKNIFGKYYQSIKTLKEYEKTSFGTPEFWIYGDVPLDKCKFGEIDFKLFKSKTGFGKKEIEERGIKEFDKVVRK